MFNYIQVDIENFDYSGSSAMPYASGMVCYDHNNHRFSLLNTGTGIAEMVIDSEVKIALNRRTKEILRWAELKMMEEKSLDEMCEKYPAVKELREQLETMKALVNENT